MSIFYLKVNNIILTQLFGKDIELSYCYAFTFPRANQQYKSVQLSQTPTQLINIGNIGCSERRNCCSDYAVKCAPISDQDLENFSKTLIVLEKENNATRYININKLGKRLLLNSSDLSLLPLIKLLTPLYNIYHPSTSVAESYSAQNDLTIKAFIDAVLSTPLMRKAQEFLRLKGKPADRDDFYKLWFKLYARGDNGVISSCGFEHVFKGEVKKLPTPSIKGFHSWIYFFMQENLNKVKHIDSAKLRDHGWNGSSIEHRFSWNVDLYSAKQADSDTRYANIEKSGSTMFIGTSPELELAMYTVCFHGKPNGYCPINLGGTNGKLKIRTCSTLDYNVGTAHPVIPGSTAEEEECQIEY